MPLSPCDDDDGRRELSSEEENVFLLPAQLFFQLILSLVNFIPLHSSMFFPHIHTSIFTFPSIQTTAHTRFIHTYRHTPGKEQARGFSSCLLCERGEKYRLIPNYVIDRGVRREKGAWVFFKTASGQEGNKDERRKLSVRRAILCLRVFPPLPLGPLAERERKGLTSM